MVISREGLALRVEPWGPWSEALGSRWLTVDDSPIPKLTATFVTMGLAIEEKLYLRPQICIAKSAFSLQAAAGCP